MYRSALGQVASAAGPINGVATLKYDVQRSAAAVVEVYGSQLSLDKSDYVSLLRQAKNDPSALTNRQMAPERTRNFILGVMGDVASAAARAEQLSLLRVTTAQQRAENHAAQAELVGAARIMLDAANTALRNATPVRNGASGLGAAPLVVGVIVAIAVVYIILGATVVAAIALCYDARERMTHARAAAERACSQQGGCTPEQYAEIVRQMQLGPLDALARGGESALSSVGEGIGTTVILVGAAAVGVGALWFLFGTRTGRKTISGFKEAAK